MAKAKCCLCAMPIGGFMGLPGSIIDESYINKIPACYDFFPSAPHKSFEIGDRYICKLCSEKLIHLFRCKLYNKDTSSEYVGWYPLLWQEKEKQDNEIDDAIHHVTYFKSYKHRNTSDDNVNRFLDYALSIPYIININAILGKQIDINNQIYQYIDELNNKLLSILLQLKSQSRFAQSDFHSFSITENFFVFINYNEKTLSLNIENLRQSGKKILQKMHDNFLSDCMELETFINQVRNFTIPVPTKISLDKIKHYKMVGSIGYSSNIHGGGGSGGGANIGGAIVGGLLFGGAGAIIGSQMGTEIHIDEIETEVTQHDDRSVEFFYEDENEKTNSIIFDSSAYDCLMKLIPEKAFDSVVTNTPKKEEPPIATPTTSLSQIKELKELLDLGIITQEEFDAKKKQLLGL